MNYTPSNGFTPTQQPIRPHRSRFGWIRTLLLALIFFLLGAYGYERFVSKNLSPAQSEIAELRNEVQLLQTQVAGAPSAVVSRAPEIIREVSVDSDVTRVVEAVGPAVVTITAEKPADQSYYGYWGFFYQNQGPSRSMGSGVIIHSDGYILTNHHVVDGAEKFTVELSNGETVPAELINADEFSDLAVLKIESAVPAVAELGDSDALKSGETVIAIGSPLGNFKNTVTTGVVSATGRFLQTEEGYYMENLIQTDAAINQGNSGGPLMNLDGKVIGINVMIVRGSATSSSTAEGLGFAIPSNTAKLIADQIIANGDFKRPSLGIQWLELTPRISRRYGLPVSYGTYIYEVVRGGAADRAGLRAGDILTKIGTQTIDADSSFYNALFAYQPGETVTVEYIRNSQPYSTEVTLGGADSPSVGL